MPDIASLEAFGWGAVGVVVAAWLVVSFTRGERARGRTAWIGTTALYAALATLFATLVRRAWAADRTALWLVFGFLLAVFVSGFVVSSVRTVLAFRGRSSRS